MDNKIKNDIPKNVRKRLDDTYENLLTDDKKVIKNNKSTIKRATIGITSAVASFALILGIGVYNPSLADNIPILDSMIDKLHYALKNKDDLKDNIEKINMSSTSDGLTMTVDNTMYDSNNVLVDFTIKTDKPFKSTKYIKSINNSYDDGSKRISFYFPDFKIDGIENTSYSFEDPKVEFIDDYTLKGSVIFEFTSISEIKNDVIDFNMDLKLCDNEANEDGKSEIFDGVWSFNFPISTNKEDTKFIEVNETKNNFRLNQVLVSPMTVTIDFQTPKEYEQSYDIMENVEVRDNKGNILWATLSDNVDDKKEVPNPRFIQRYSLEEIGQDLESLEIRFYGKWNEETKSAPILANFDVKLNK